MTYAEQVLAWVERYFAVGWIPIILPPKSKSPFKRKGWQKERPTLEDFRKALEAGDVNVGILLGEDVLWLIRVDLDTVEAMRAFAYGPRPTPCVMGREGIALPTGYLFLVQGTLAGPMTYKDPIASKENSTLCDVLSTGKQTVVAPSQHPDGGQYVWHSFGAPVAMSGDEVMTHTAHRMAAALLATHLGGGARHDGIIAVAGGLAAAGWTLDQAEEWINVVLYAMDDDEVEDRIRAVYDTFDRYALGRDIVGWPRLEEYTDPRVVRRICDWLGISASKKINQLQQRGDLRTTDIGNAERFIARHGEIVRWCGAIRKWLVWDGTRWKPDDTGIVGSKAVDTVLSLYDEATLADTRDKRQIIANWAVTSEEARHHGALLMYVKTYQQIAVLPEQLDVNPWILNTRSGILDLKTLKLTGHDPGELLTHSTLIDYDPEAPAPRWRQFIQEIFDGDAEVMGVAKRAAGLSLTGSMREQMLFVCVGDGQNGKTKFLYGLRSGMGTYAGTTAFDTFEASDRRGQASNDLAAIRGKRLITAVEAEQEKRLAEARVKAVTGGDPISCRHLYGEFFEYSPTYKIWLAVNHRPIIRGIDHGIWRRLCLLPFLVKFAGINDDKDLDEKIWAERVGILAWMVEGLREYLERGLDPPKVVQDAVATYRRDMDLVADFLEANTAHDATAACDTRDLYVRYTYWAKDFGERQLSHRALALQLEPRGYTRRKSNGKVYWEGLRLLPELFSATPAVNGTAHE